MALYTWMSFKCRVIAISMCREWLFILNVALMSIYRYTGGLNALFTNICRA